MCLSTDKGTVQKVIVLPRDDLQTEELVLEEVEVFKVGLLSYFLFFSNTPLIFLDYLLHNILMSYSQQLVFFPVKVPTPITTMKISSKRVSKSEQRFPQPSPRKKEIIFQRKQRKLSNLEKLQAKYMQLCLTEASLHKSSLERGPRKEKYGKRLVCPDKHSYFT